MITRAVLELFQSTILLLRLYSIYKTNTLTKGGKKISAQKMLIALFYFQAPVNNRINSIWSFIYQNASGLASSHFR